MLHEEVHQGPGHRGRRVQEERRDPQNGSLQLLDIKEEVVPVLDGEQVVVVALQDARVKGGHVGLPAHVLVVHLRGGEVTAKHKVRLVDFIAAAAAREDAAVPHHGAHVVVLVVDRRRVWKQGLEVVADGEHVLVTGIVEMHQLTHAHAVLGEGEVVGDVDEMEDLFPGRQVKGFRS